MSASDATKSSTEIDTDLTRNMANATLTHADSSNETTDTGVTASDSQMELRKMESKPFRFNDLPTELMLDVTDYLPLPQYQVIMRITHASTCPDSPHHVENLIYRVFSQELDALRDIYRLNSYQQFSGDCICNDIPPSAEDLE